MGTVKDKQSWVGFNPVQGIGAVGLPARCSYIGDLALAWQASAEPPQAAGPIPKLVERVAQVGGLNCVAVREEQAGYLA